MRSGKEAEILMTEAINVHYAVAKRIARNTKKTTYAKQSLKR